MTSWSRRVFLSAAGGMACAVAARAQDDSEIGQSLEALYAALEAVMRSGRGTPFAQRFDTLAPAIERAFDLDTILKVSVGQRWDSLNSQAEARLATTFHRFTVATYVANFDKYDGEQFKVLPGSRESGSDRIVRTEIVDANGGRIRLDYVMRASGRTWRAVDVLLDGSISRVAVQRSDFRKILGSGDAEALVASLRRKITDLSGGALNS